MDVPNLNREGLSLVAVLLIVAALFLGPPVLNAWMERQGFRRG